jgi:Arc/MetJ-type ribon-helix-helix transcriptional regulator
MTSMQIELPDQLAGAIQRLVQNGWFQTEREIIRLALVEFIHRHQAELTEQFQREDIAWALAQIPPNQPQV